MKKVVVTGGAGFIGSNLAEELVKKHYVVVVDDLSTGRMDNIQNLIGKENFEFVKCSITDLDSLKKIFQDVDYVFHQAAIPSVQRSIENPIAINEVNVAGTLNVLVAARDCGVKKVIYASSSSVYGDTPELPKREDMKPNPLSPYAVSKLIGEYYCKVFSEIYGLKAVSLRYFNVYGPKQDPNSEYAAVVPKFIQRILNNLPPVIYGDGKQTRDLIFVKDAVKANILAMKKNVEGVFNIAYGKDVSINELANKIMEIMGVELNPIYDEPRKGDIRHSLADISLARKKLGYEPECDLEKGLKETINYFKVIA
jgi:UDP-glucose 4-epimerase